ncbi:hypothetical protein DFH07DRAFT_821177 [Mycena maculata]|uniref:DUF6699 domain-containing protein n=1 Tax=Mycena maculata TaxID=230809 RepID=A0AAD7J2A3_9AGAR|nr:hypothetical protein DFH07DRAFT_821177 [Mycena maculata]
MPVPATTRYVGGAFAYASSSTSPYPSPTYTMSSLSTSPGPMSPPPFNHSRSLYACAPLPALNEPGHVHNVLSGAHGRRHFMAFDVSYDPAYTVSASPVLSPRVLAEPATTPHLPCVTIMSDLFPWRISIYPSSSKPGAYVTVADVLNGIYRGLRQQVRRDELDTLPVPQPFVTAVRKAFHSRCSRVARAGDPVAADSEARKGIRRMDFLLGNHMFAGLLPTSENPDVWKLVVSL